MKTSVTMRFALFWLALAAGAGTHAADQRQEPQALRQTVEQFLRMQTTGLPGQVSILLGALDPRLNLPACAMPEAFLPNGSRAWGKTTVGVRCPAPAPWTIYISATVRVQADYVASAVPLAQGQTILEKDIVTLSGDLTKLPPGIITAPAQAIGRIAAASLPMGTPLRQDALRGQPAVQQGQAVRLILSSANFRVSNEAHALANAAEGQWTQVRTSGGQVVSGMAKSGGIVEITY